MFSIKLVIEQMWYFVAGVSHLKEIVIQRHWLFLVSLFCNVTNAMYLCNGLWHSHKLILKVVWNYGKKSVYYDNGTYWKWHWPWGWTCLYSIDRCSVWVQWSDVHLGVTGFVCKTHKVCNCILNLHSKIPWSWARFHCKKYSVATIL